MPQFDDVLASFGCPCFDFVAIQIVGLAVEPLVNVYAPQVAIGIRRLPFVLYALLEPLLHQEKIQTYGTYAQLCGDHRGSEPFAVLDREFVVPQFVAVATYELFLAPYGIMLVIDDCECLFVGCGRWQQQILRAELLSGVRYRRYRLRDLLQLGMAIAQQVQELLAAPCRKGRREPLCELRPEMYLQPCGTVRTARGDNLLSKGRAISVALTI